MTELTREQIDTDHAVIKDFLPPSMWTAADRQRDLALRTHDAEQRAEDAEADNERLRKLLSQWSESWHDVLSGGPSGDLIHDTDEALATPPDGESPAHASVAEAATWELKNATYAPQQPEGEKCSHARVQGNGSEYLCVDCGHRFTTMFDRDATDATQQPEDALAAWRTVQQAAHVSVMDARWEDRDEVEKAIKAVGRRLSASAVPYVPDEVRRLPERWKRDVKSYALGHHSFDRAKQNCAEDLERALAAAPTKGERRDE